MSSNPDRARILQGAEKELSALSKAPIAHVWLLCLIAGIMALALVTYHFAERARLQGELRSQPATLAETFRTS